MSDMITAEKAQATLDTIIGVTSDALPFVKDLLRTVIALYAQLADAKAAQAMVGKLEAALSGGVLSKNDASGLLSRLAAAEADRDRLAAANAALEAQVARLVGALHEARDAAHSVAHSEFDEVWSDQDFREFTPLADAALAEVQADDPPCTDCDDTGITHQTERFCTCGAGAALAEVQADAPTEYERKVAQMKEDFPNGI